MLNNSSFIGSIEKLLPNSREIQYLLAISGGVDSMVLMDLFRTNGFRFQVAHVNYKLRGSDSDADERLITDYCEKNSIKFHLYTISEVDAKPKNSIQNWARKLRYHFFRNIQQQEKLDELVTAHHLNDELETFVINLSRGSGLSGLSGIPAKKNKIVRPFLKISKADIYAFAADNNIAYLEDESNKKGDYLRNKIRLEIVPILVETNEFFLENFKKSIALLHQNKIFIKKQIAEIEKRIITDDSAEKVCFDKEFFDKQDDFVKYEILKKYGFDDTNEIKKIFNAETGKSFYSKNYQLVINRDLLEIKKNCEHAETISDIIILQHISKIGNSILKLQEIAANKQVRITNHASDSDFILATPWEFDASAITLPLKIRHKKAGDVFYPTGMSGKKKVSKYFKDEKISILDKEEIWLLADGNDDVLGIIPYRQDRRFAANKKTIVKVIII